MSRPTREEVLEWAVGCGDWNGETCEMNDVGLQEFAALAYATGRESMRIELQTELQRLITLANAAEKWRGIAIARDGDGRTVQEIQEDA